MEPRRYARRAILLGLPLTCLLLASCSSTVRSQGMKAYTDSRTALGPAVVAQAEEQSFATVFALAAPMYLYYVEHDRWPTTASQLQDTAREFDLSFDVSIYANLEMRELGDGRLRVYFHLAPPGQEEGEFTLSKPDTDKDEGVVQQYANLVL